MVLLYGLATDKDYLHYAGELLPNLLLMVGFYIFVVWVGGPAERRASASRWLLFSGGLVLGAAPWCKLQAAPITLALGLVFLAAVLRDRGRSFSLSRRMKELIAFSVGAVLTTCVMLAILAKCGAISDFWYSYIQGNLAYAGPLSLTSIIAKFWFTFLTWPIHEPLLVAFLGLGLLVRTSPSANVLLFSKEKKWAFNAVLVYAGAALIAICRSQYSFHHYTIFLVPPMTYLAAVAFSAPPEAVELLKSRRSPPRVTFALVLILVFATIGGIQYANMVRVIGELSHGPLDRNPRIAKAPGVPVMNSNDRTGQAEIYPRLLCHYAVFLAGKRFERKNCRGRPRHPGNPPSSEYGGMGMGARSVCSHRNTSRNPRLGYILRDHLGANADVLPGAFSC